MQIKYLRAAWGDLKNSRGWFIRMLLLGLLAFIPVLGDVIAYGYLYGWARDLAWGMRAPLGRVFDNPDGKLFRRGFFIWLIGLVFGIIPTVLMLAGSAPIAAAIDALGSGSYDSVSYGAVVGGYALTFAGIFLLFVFGMFASIAAVRMSIYDRLGTGFQLRRIFAMYRHDWRGAWRILGMQVALWAIFLSVFILVLIVILIIFSIAMISSVAAVFSSGLGFTFISTGVIMFAVVLTLALSYLTSVFSNVVTALTARAWGLWTYQFAVPYWRGSNDPLPFEEQSNNPWAGPARGGY